MPDDEILELLAEAAQAMSCAYAPYSDYPVGAAVRSEDGHVYSGCNVENVSYGLTNCAERSAVFSAVREGRRSLSAVAVVSADDPLPYPCGACRQVLSEFCRPECPIYIAGRQRLKDYRQTTLGELLPRAFRSIGRDTA